jgi:molybdate transport system substrate-binding protein
MIRRSLRLLVLLLFAFLPSAAPAQNAEIVVSAAASLTDVLTMLQPEAAREIGARILFNFGASGSLRKQIEEGAPVDVFFSASSEDMDRLESKGLVLRGSRRDLLSNTLVLIGGEGSREAAGREELRALLEAARLVAVGDPDSVSAGRNAQQALKALDLFDIVFPKRVLGASVREVLQFVQSGSAPLGVVFATDAAAAGSRVRSIFRFPSELLKSPILYPVAVVGATKNPETAVRLVAFLEGARARDAFRSAGFILP